MNEDADAADRWLLDLLCSCADNGVRVTYIRQPMRPSLGRLRRAGLVAHDSLLPSPSAQIAWYDQKAQRVVSQFSAPAEAESTPELTPEPPPKPKRRANPTIVEKAKRWEAKHKSVGSHSPAGAPGDSRAASSGDSSALRSAAAPGLPDEAPPAPAEFALRPWSPPQPPTYETAPLTRGEKQSLRMSAGKRRALLAEAERRVDAGQNPGSVQMGDLRMMIRSVINRRDAESRLTDPLKSAMLTIQQRRIRVFSATISGGPEGHYYVGNTLMTEAEMMSYADGIRGRAA